jgi:hypothetical protein
LLRPNERTIDEGIFCSSTSGRIRCDLWYGRGHAVGAASVRGECQCHSGRRWLRSRLPSRASWRLSCESRRAGGCGAAASSLPLLGAGPAGLPHLVVTCTNPDACIHFYEKRAGPTPSFFSCSYCRHSAQNQASVF